MRIYLNIFIIIDKSLITNLENNMYMHNNEIYLPIKNWINYHILKLTFLYFRLFLIFVKVKGVLICHMVDRNTPIVGYLHVFAYK